MTTVFLSAILGAALPIASEAAFDFSLAGGGSLSVTQGESITETITATLSSSAIAEPVEFAARDLPPGATYLFSTAVCLPTCASTLTIRTARGTPAGQYVVNVVAVGAGRTRFAPITVQVFAATSAVEGRFNYYNRVVTTAHLDIHTNPSTVTGTLGSQAAGALGTIIGGPVAADRAIWWNVSFDTGPSGWALDQFMAKQSVALGLRGDCSSEGSLAGRTDIVFCEPWEDPAWWQNGYLADGSKAKRRPATPGTVARTSLVSSGCISGQCLEVDMRKGEAGALALHWPLSAAGQHPEELFIRYYLKLSASFDPNVCARDGSIQDSGGKLPGPADVRTDADVGGQCGNGGNPADGINCWSMRSVFRDCYGGASGSACSVRGSTVRFGHYAYFYANRDFWGVAGYWDANSYSQSTGDGGTCRTMANNVFCGLGNAGNLVRNRWYRVEIHVKMNTPGRADGVLQGWMDGVKSFEKTNMIYRLPGHDDLHVRTMWLNVHKGGDYPNGNCVDQKVWLDQMVLATGGLVGPWQK